MENRSSTLVECIKFLSGLAMALIVLSLVVRPGCFDRNSTVHLQPTNDMVRELLQPQERIEEANWIENSQQISCDSELVYPQIKKQLQELAGFFQASRKQPQTSPKFVSQNPLIKSLDRQHLVSAYRGQRIRVARWRSSNQALRFSGSTALNEFVDSLFEPWKTSQSFRIEMSVSQVTFQEPFFDVQVLVEFSGKLDARCVRSATAIWRTVWERNDDSSELTLTKIETVGHEELVSYVPNGSLFVDVTKSVIRSEKLAQHLGRSTTDLAKDIPQIDVFAQCGMAIGDINQDGLQDIYVCQPHGIPNLVLVQNPDGSVDDVGKTDRARCLGPYIRGVVGGFRQ